MTDFETNPIGTMQELHRLKDERNALSAHVERLQAFRSAVCGWRESDWPEGFCRRTAELVADLGRQAEGVNDD